MTALYDVLKSGAGDATKLALVADFDRVLSLDLVAHAEKLKNAEPSTPEIDADFAKEIESLIAERAEAKKAKNFARADEIRKYLSDKGVTLVDSREGTTYKIGG